MLRDFIRRLLLGGPLLLPAYIMNLAAVFLMNSIFHLSAIGILSTVVIGDLIAYAGNTALAPYFLIYLKKTKYYSKDELQN